MRQRRRQYTTPSTGHLLAKLVLNIDKPRTAPRIKAQLSHTSVGVIAGADRVDWAFGQLISPPPRRSRLACTVQGRQDANQKGGF